jgi:hypothetical protein
MSNERQESQPSMLQPFGPDDSYLSSGQLILARFRFPDN